MKISNKKRTLLILIAIVMISSVWLLNKGITYEHDIAFHYNRLIGLTEAIKSGDIFAYIHNSFHGYGYATGLFYSNFFFYIPAIISTLGINYVASIKILYFIINISTVISIYFCTKSITNNNKSSLIVTVLYMFSNYRIIDIFVRGAIGEMLSFMIIPLVILGLYEIIYRDYKKWYLFTLGFVLLLFAHLITTVFVAFFSLIIILVNYKKFLEEKDRIKYLIISGIVGLLLSSSFILPMLEQIKASNVSVFVNKGYYNLSEEAVNLFNFIIPTDFFNKYLGYSLILILPIRFYIKKKNTDILKFADILYILGIISWISTTCLFPWDILNNQLKFVQFPWRLLIITTSFLCMSYSIYFKILIDEDKKKLLTYSYVVILIISLLTITVYSIKYGFREIHFTNFEENQIGGAEYLLAETEYGLIDRSEEPPYTTNDPEIIIDYTKIGKTVVINYKNNNNKDTFIEVPLFNYLGYKVKGADLEMGFNGLIRLTNLKKEGNIKVYYTGTNIQKISNIIYTLSFVGIVVYIIIERKR